MSKTNQKSVVLTFSESEDQTKFPHFTCEKSKMMNNGPQFEVETGAVMLGLHSDAQIRCLNTNQVVVYSP